MSNLTVNLTPELHDFVLTSVHSGRYESASELVRIALHSFRHELKNSMKKRSASDPCHDDPYRELWKNSDHSLLSPQ
jgi:putative addiction module CopG family antidote